MPISEFHRVIATIALRAAAPHGFALGGGNALIAHGIIDRPTEDVDVFSDIEGGVEAAAEAVETGLRDAGFETERQDKIAGLADIFEGMCLVHTNNPHIRFEPVGATPVMWNDAEWLASKRRE